MRLNTVINIKKIGNFKSVSINNQLSDYKKNDPSYKIMLQNAKEALSIVVGPRNKVYSVIGRANLLNFEITEIIYKYE